MSNYVLTPSAQADADDIGEYTQREWGKEQRQTYLADIQATLELLVDMPGIGRNVSHLHKRLRAYPSGAHVIFYREDADRITVIRILHQQQSAIRAFANSTGDL